ncbi:MAG: choice-of-anchor X domain-containing protein [Thermoanaerobaculia bacterium]
MRRQHSIAVAVAAALMLAAFRVQAGDRNLAIVVDTSGSMQGNDRQRYTVQLAQVLSDLANDTDSLSVIRMPDDLLSFCWAGASPSLVMRLDPSNRAAFKRELDRNIQFETGTYFAAPIRTAISVLPRNTAAPRMLLIIADSGGLGGCETDLTQELLALKRTGVTIAAINLGSTSGAFDANPAFDFTTAALHAQGLIEAVALVYQRFLGAKQVQTGVVQGDIEVDVAPFVREAFLVVAADGPIGAITETGTNPGRKAIDLNHRGGGSTRGLDGEMRGYRIVHLERPAAGRWRFRASGLVRNAGWMLVQDSAVGARLITPPIVPSGVAVPLEVELFDQRTGQRITDTSTLPGLQVSADVDGKKVTFRDDGREGDRQAGDGILTGTTTFDSTGDKQLDVKLQSDFLDRNVRVGTKVVEAMWQLQVQSPRRAEATEPVALSVALRAFGSASVLQVPSQIDVLAGGLVAELRDDGRASDRQAGDRIFTGTWTPPEPDQYHLEYVARGGSAAAPVKAVLEAIGRLRFGRAVPIRFGRITSQAQATGQLDLGSADVRGTFDLQVTTSFDRARSVLEIDSGNGWKPLDDTPRALRLSDRGARRWPVRLRVGECPQACSSNDPFEVVVTGTGADGRPVRMAVPVAAEIVADPWLLCWWPVLASVAGLLLAAIVIHGYWVPSRFPARLGVVLSPETDISEGFFHPIRGQRGSGSGFYRDARIYVCHDFRLAGKPRNAVARLRAGRKQIRIEPAAGAAVWRQNADGVWEQIPPGESPARFGDLYRNDSGTLFFEVRNA